jgi:hypothetical protein
MIPNLSSHCFLSTYLALRCSLCGRSSSTQPGTIAHSRVVDGRSSALGDCNYLILRCRLTLEPLRIEQLHRQRAGLSALPFATHTGEPVGSWKQNPAFFLREYHNPTDPTPLVSMLHFPPSPNLLPFTSPHSLSLSLCLPLPIPIPTPIPIQPFHHQPVLVVLILPAAVAARLVACRRGGRPRRGLGFGFGFGGGGGGSGGGGSGGGAVGRHGHGRTGTGTGTGTGRSSRLFNGGGDATPLPPWTARGGGNNNAPAVGSASGLEEWGSVGSVLQMLFLIGGASGFARRADSGVGGVVGRVGIVMGGTIRGGGSAILGYESVGRKGGRGCLQRQGGPEKSRCFMRWHVQPLKLFSTECQRNYTGGWY